MDLECKIKAKYLDEILEGSKREEFRQFDTILFVDERGRRARFEIDYVFEVEYTEEERIRESYPDVPWKVEKAIYGFRLGKKVVDDG